MTDILACNTTRDALKETQNKIGHLINKYDNGELLAYEVVEKFRQLHKDLIELRKNPLT